MIGLESLIYARIPQERGDLKTGTLILSEYYE